MTMPETTPEMLAMARQSELIERFKQAVAAMPPEVGARLALGQQFNAYEDASNDEDGEPDWWDYHLAIGPISDHRKIAQVEGEASATLLEAALKLAAHTALRNGEHYHD